MRVGPAMRSILTQLRALYLARRQQPAPSSVVLIGVRSIRPRSERLFPRTEQVDGRTVHVVGC